METRINTRFDQLQLEDKKTSTSLLAHVSQLEQKIKNIMKYLYDTKDLGLVLHPVENYNDPLQFYC
jgi:hypothetical protein